MEKENPNNHLVMVYGTLKRGGGLHSALETERYIGVRDVTGMEVYCNGCFPYAVFSSGAKYYEGTRKFIPNPESDTRLIGEVYEVDAVTLDHLDMIEGEGIHYNRVAVEIDGQWVWIYVVPYNTIIGKEFCESGWWSDPDYIRYDDDKLPVAYVESIVDYYQAKILDNVHPDNKEDVTENLEDMLDALEVWE